MTEGMDSMMQRQRWLSDSETALHLRAAGSLAAAVIWEPG